MKIEAFAAIISESESSDFCWWLRLIGHRCSAWKSENIFHCFAVLIERVRLIPSALEARNLISKIDYVSRADEIYSLSIMDNSRHTFETRQITFLKVFPLIRGNLGLYTHWQFFIILIDSTKTKQFFCEI